MRNTRYYYYIGQSVRPYVCGYVSPFVSHQSLSTYKSHQRPQNPSNQFLLYATMQLNHFRVYYIYIETFS